MEIKNHLNKNKYIKKADVIYITSLVVCTLCVIGLIVFFTYKPADLVIIESDGKVYGKYNLSENQLIQLDCEECVGCNIVQIENNKVFMLDADCPDKLCVNQRAINSNLGAIVCLPNKVVVYIDAEDYSEVDVVS